MRRYRNVCCKSKKVELHFSLLRGTANDPDMQKIRVIEILFENKPHLADGIPAVTITVSTCVRIFLQRHI